MYGEGKHGGAPGRGAICISIVAPLPPIRQLYGTFGLVEMQCSYARSYGNDLHGRLEDGGWTQPAGLGNAVLSFLLVRLHEEPLCYTAFPRFLPSGALLCTSVAHTAFIVARVVGGLHAGCCVVSTWVATEVWHCSIVSKLPSLL